MRFDSKLLTQSKLSVYSNANELVTHALPASRWLRIFIICGGRP